MEGKPSKEKAFACAFPSAACSAGVMPTSTANILFLEGRKSQAKDGKRERPKEPRCLMSRFNNLQLL